jgi:predicted DNA-binding transcriptional regulator AlpA
MEKHLTTREVAEMLGLKPDTVKIWRMQGKGPKWQKVGTKAVRYSLTAVNDWLNAASKASLASSKLRTSA